MAPANDPILRTSLSGVRLANPVMCAAGTAGVLDEMGEVIDLSSIGAIVTKSITRKPRDGNDTWRLVPSRAGMLNAIGLANPGLVRFLADHSSRAASMPCAVVASVAGFCVSDYSEVVSALAAVEGIDGLELNVSCPNVRGGAEFGSDTGALGELMRAVRPLSRGRPLFVKLSPIAVAAPRSMVDMASVAVDGGADALVISNTVPAMQIDVETRRPVLANVTGGLSGPAIHQIVVKLVHDVYTGVAREARVPVVGVGGVSSWRDAAEFMLAGASAVQVGSMSMADPKSPVRIARGLARWAHRQRVSGIDELVGALRPPDSLFRPLDMYVDDGILTR